jgi:hypothetical protein
VPRWALAAAVVLVLLLGLALTVQAIIAFALISDVNRLNHAVCVLNAHAHVVVITHCGR